MVHFQFLKASFGEKIIVDTYDQAIIEHLIEELKKHFETDRILSEKLHNGCTSIFTKKKDNINISRQLVLHLIGSEGWEPFCVEQEHNSYYFRKKTDV